MFDLKGSSFAGPRRRREAPYWQVTKRKVWVLATTTSVAGGVEEAGGGRMEKEGGLRVQEAEESRKRVRKFGKTRRGRRRQDARRMQEEAGERRKRVGKVGEDRRR